MLPVFFPIKDIWQETSDVYTLRIQLPKSLHKTMRPGQFNMLYSFGAGEVPISLSRIEKNNCILHTIRQVGQVTENLVNLKPGDEIGLRGPFGVCWPIDQLENKDVILMAGGIGLAPLRPVIDYIIQHRFLFGNVMVWYGAREKKDLLFESEWISWMQAGVELNVSLDHLNLNDKWDGEVGVVTSLIDVESFKPQNTVAMICGPEIMMRFSAQRLVDLGVDEKNVYLSQERNMKCAIGLCGHCQYRGDFICKTGPVFDFKKIKDLLVAREV